MQRNLKRFTRFFALMLAVLGLVAASASAATLYVDPGSIGGPCSDANSVALAQSTQTPWCSLPQAIKAAPDGSTVDVRASNIPAFIDHWPLGYTHLQNRSSDVTFEPYGYGGSSPEQVTLNGMDLIGVDHEVWQGFTMNGSYPDGGRLVKAVNLAGCSPYMSFLDNTIQGEAIKIDGRCSYTPGGLSNQFSPGGGHDVVQGNQITTAPVNGNQCAAGVINNDDGMGVIFFGADDIQVVGNTLNTTNDAINYSYADNVLIKGNTVKTNFQSQMPAACGYHVDLTFSEGHKHGPATIEDNWYQQGGQAIFNNQTGLKFENNLVTNVSGWIQFPSDPGAQIISNTFDSAAAHAPGSPQGGQGAGDVLIRQCATTATRDCSTVFTDGYFTDITGVVVENNVLDYWSVDTSASSQITPSEWSEDYNLVALPQNSPSSNPGTHDISAAATFRKATRVQTTDWTLAYRTPGWLSGDGSVAPPTDINGVTRPSVPDIGALQHS